MMRFLTLDFLLRQAMQAVLTQRLLAAAAAAAAVSFSLARDLDLAPALFSRDSKEPLAIGSAGCGASWGASITASD